ncbi:hypothetical protein POM88_038357 [Heracleum sosnowskyi]|uniref:Uncharacterized protein n=1 Tax=Heracleum sosnowskyi TaxID=360622 RepID=A0AAD8H9F5_9APIA|nr:hypothetical protein POM88_038357 [Heracleum sosnowskyi]
MALRVIRTTWLAHLYQRVLQTCMPWIGIYTRMGSSDSSPHSLVLLMSSEELVPGVSKSSSGFKVAQLAQRIYGSGICNEGYLTAKADVYSFSIVPLETVSRKSNTNFIPKEEFVSLIDQESLSGPKSGEVDESSDSWRLQAWSS